MRSEVSQKTHLFICLFLIIAIFSVYGQVWHHKFIDFDDEEYIVQNPHVNSGLSIANVVWAFNSAYSNNWHPLTWISHMTDVELFGLNPRGHHLMNVLFHAINSVLLFLLFLRMTGKTWQCAALAAFFALHPLHVESVAWAAERKDVLSTFFWLLTIWAYIRYTEIPHWKRYGMVVACFSLGLMAKQMLVTLPFVLLLLDYWPLGRFASTPATFENQSSKSSLKKRHNGRAVTTVHAAVSDRHVIRSRWQHLIVEKIPLLLLAAAASTIIFMVQLKSGVLFGLSPFPLNARIANTVISYMTYMVDMVWPIHLAVFYPHPQGTLPLGTILGAAILLIVITAACLKFHHKPYLPVGWFWYLGTLVPVIGLVQVGVQARADRYTYIPLIGLFIIIAWGLPDFLGKWPYKKQAIITFAIMTLTSCTFLTWSQVSTWKDRETLYAHAVHVTHDNYWAYNNLGAAVAAKGNLDEAMTCFSNSLAIMPLYPGANKNMAVILFKKQRYSEAIPYLQRAMQMQPRETELYVIMGMTLLKMGNVEEAISRFQEAIKLNPADPDAREGLQEALAAKQTTNLRINHTGQTP
ncbi:MAG: hypothetical protein CSYNP_00005 [Syntrophus sp. SKADARSKE-3]|nr:hypothetical protein [Syntrophus sp. SKADARSKE-3]